MGLFSRNYGQSPSNTDSENFAAEAKQSRRNAAKHERKGNTEAADRQTRLADWAEEQAKKN
jgi:hypothetical protein